MNNNGKINLKRQPTHVNFQATLRCNHDNKFFAKSVNTSLSCINFLTYYITKRGISSYKSQSNLRSQQYSGAMIANTLFNNGRYGTFLLDAS